VAQGSLVFFKAHTSPSENSDIISISTSGEEVSAVAFATFSYKKQFILFLKTYVLYSYFSLPVCLYVFVLSVVFEALS
jgi:hypothetical protein